MSSAAVVIGALRVNAMPNHRRSVSVYEYVVGKSAKIIMLRVLKTHAINMKSGEYFFILAMLG